MSRVLPELSLLSLGREAPSPPPGKGRNSEAWRWGCGIHQALRSGKVGRKSLLVYTTCPEWALAAHSENPRCQNKQGLGDHPGRPWTWPQCELDVGLGTGAGPGGGWAQLACTMNT